MGIYMSDPRPDGKLSDKNFTSIIGLWLSERTLEQLVKTNGCEGPLAIGSCPLEGISRRMADDMLPGALEGIQRDAKFYEIMNNNHLGRQ